MSELMSPEVGTSVRPNPIGPSQSLVTPGPRLPRLRAFLGGMLQEIVRQTAAPPPVAAEPLTPTPAPEPVAARAGAPSAAQATPTEPPAEPPPEPWEHWLAIRARLSRFEASVVDTTLGVVKPEWHAEWLTAMSVLSIDQAVDLVRSMIHKAPQRPPTTADSAASDGGSCA